MPAFLPFISNEFFTDYIRKLGFLTEDSLNAIYNEMPPRWTNGKENNLQDLASFVVQRARYLKDYFVLNLSKRIIIP